MLGLQAGNLEQQERLFKNQIRLGLREILQQELAFYNQAFNNISACASILAGFAFTGIMLDPYDHKSSNQPKWIQHHEFDGSRLIEAIFNYSCAATTCICLLTVVYSNYLGLFSTRLALRGGEMAVEDSVMKVRGEYKVVLYALTGSIECFIFTLTIMAFYKMELLDCCLVASISLPSGIAVLYLYRRARMLFYLDKHDRFAAAKKNVKKENFFSSNRTSDDYAGVNRLSEIVNDLDGRNNAMFDLHNQYSRGHASSWESMGHDGLLSSEHGYYGGGGGGSPSSAYSPQPPHHKGYPKHRNEHMPTLAEAEAERRAAAADKAKSKGWAFLKKKSKSMNSGKTGSHEI